MPSSSETSFLLRSVPAARGGTEAESILCESSSLAVFRCCGAGNSVFGRFLSSKIRGDIAHPDALHDAVRPILPSGEAETLRSLLRCCQKELERSA